MSDVALELARKHIRPGETVLWWARPSLVGLVPILASSAAGLTAIVVSAWLGIDEPGTILRGTPALVLAVGGVLVETARRFVRLRFTTFVITDERLYAITSFLETNARSVPLARATSVAVRQGLFGRALGFWNGRIATYGAGERAVQVPAIRDGPGLLRHTREGLRRGANVEWLRRGD